MAGLLARMPISFGFGLWDMSNGNKYTIEDNTTVLPPVLEESDRETDAAYDERYKQQSKKENGGKGKGTELKKGVKVEKNQLNKEQVQTPKKKEKVTRQKEIADD